MAGESEAEWPENVGVHTYTQTQTHNHAALAGISTTVWRLLY
jgi:hypothetical protein